MSMPAWSEQCCSHPCAAPNAQVHSVQDDSCGRIAAALGNCCGGGGVGTCNRPDLPSGPLQRPDDQDPLPAAPQLPALGVPVPRSTGSASVPACCILSGRPVNAFGLNRVVMHLRRVHADLFRADGQQVSFFQPHLASCAPAAQYVSTCNDPNPMSPSHAVMCNGITRHHSIHICCGWHCVIFKCSQCNCRCCA